MYRPWDEASVRSWAKALRHRDCLVRRHAASALCEVGPDAALAVEDLGRALADNDEGTVAWASRALAKIGEPALAHLTSALLHPAAHVRCQAVWALKELGPIALPAQSTLIHALKDSDLRVRLGAAQALGTIGPDAADAVPALVQGLMSNNLIFCRLCAQALSRIGQAALPVLREMQHNHDRHARREASWAIKQIEGVRPASLTMIAHPKVKLAPESKTQIVENTFLSGGSHAKTDALPLSVGSKQRETTVLAIGRQR